MVDILRVRTLAVMVGELACKQMICTGDSTHQRCTDLLRGQVVSHALIDLHQMGDIIVHALPDSRGWNIGEAAPPNDAKTLLADKVDRIEWKAGQR